MVTQSKPSQRVQRETWNHSVCQSECQCDQRSHQRYIVSSSLNTKGKRRSIVHYFPAWRANGPHRYILTKYRGKAKIHRPFSTNLEGTNNGNPQSASTSVHIVSSLLNTEGKWRSIAHPLPTWRAPLMSQSCKHQHVHHRTLIALITGQDNYWFLKKCL